MKTKLHIICFDIPFPANYGGVIDVFYKIKALHKLDVEITLHCFQYGNRVQQIELNKYCKEVFYYKRSTGLLGLNATLPYIVSSRNDKKLLENLLKDNEPILFEGVHSCYFLNHSLLKNRIKLLRTHNIESEYYQQLAKNSTSFFKKLYFSWESMRLISFEKRLENATALLSISKQDADYFKNLYPTKKAEWIPAFHLNNEVRIKEGKGNYCLYHGNLEVSENKEAINFLINEVFNDIEVPLIIAGKCNYELSITNFEIIRNPSDEKLQELIQNAQINILPSMQVSGIKLKLLHALFNGRFCLVNNEMLIGTELQRSIEIANSAQEFKEKIKELISESFTSEMIEERRKELVKFDNRKNSIKLITNL